MECNVNHTREPTADPTSQPTMVTNIPSKYPTSSPSFDPSTTPTTYPTTDPSTEPTPIPTKYPTNDPSINPTSDPSSFDPSSYPTNEPTMEPTFEPTRYPTATPSDDPTQDPTNDPNLHPTYGPTNDPTSKPTFTPMVGIPAIDPTLDPTNAPSNDPSRNPTANPTMDSTSEPTSGAITDPSKHPAQNPTWNPSVDPTNISTYDPTNYPSIDPTKESSSIPTRRPTRDKAYDSYVEVVYSIKDTLPSVTQYLSDHLQDEITTISSIIEESYVIYLSSKPVIWALQFYEFWVQILEINSRSIEEVLSDDNVLRTINAFVESGGLVLQSRILCSETVCNDIINRYDKQLFENVTNKLLNDHYNEVALIGVNAESMSQALSFSVESDVLVMKTFQSIEESPSSMLDYVWYVVGIGVVLLLCIITWIIKYCRDKRKLEGKTMIIKNGMVIPICIGQYEKKGNLLDAEFEGHVRNLDGISHDIEHCLDLFESKLLNYDIYPCYEDQNINSYKTYWSKSEIIDFITYHADHLNNICRNEEIQHKYDGLIVIVSGHGTTSQGQGECVITSDYKLIPKLKIHRIFGSKPGLRDIPRIFIFDSCSGEKERSTDWRAESESKSKTEQGKGLTIQPAESAQWYYGENHPDYKLAIVNAASPQFQAKMSIETGSYVITQLTERLMANINNNNGKFLIDILQKIQNDLHRKGKQLLTFMLNNETAYIKFQRNGKENAFYERIQPQKVARLDVIENKLESVLREYIGKDDQFWDEMVTKSKQLIDKIKVDLELDRDAGKQDNNEPSNDADESDEKCELIDIENECKYQDDTENVAMMDRPSNKYSLIEMENSDNENNIEMTMMESVDNNGQFDNDKGRQLMFTENIGKTRDIYSLPELIEFTSTAL